MWEISNKDQAISFLLFLCLGVIFSIIYDFFKSLRLSKKHGVFSVFLEDVLYFLLLTLATFTAFIFRTNGQPRAYAYIAELMGFILWRLTLSKYELKFLRQFFCLLFALLERLRSHISQLFSKFWDKISKLLKKLRFYLKKGLKEAKRLVYNLFNRIIGK